MYIVTGDRQKSRFESNSTVTWRRKLWISSTNFEAEYRSIIEALKYLRQHRERLNEPVNLFNDNATIISQLLGKARVKEPRLKALFDEVVSYLATYPYHVQFLWIDRKTNKAHDLF